MNNRYDAVVVGCGVAGLTAASTAAERGLSVALVCAAPPTESASYFSRGGIAVPIGEGDSVDLHVQDTLRAGCHLNCVRRVKSMVEESFSALRFLEMSGVCFDRGKDGEYHLTKEGGHSVSRILHWRDTVGRELITKLWARVSSLGSVERVRGEVVKILVNDYGEACGVLVLVGGEELVSLMGRVILAAGGGGAVYRVSSYSRGSLGTVQAMALEAGARLVDMEFVQFHPTLVEVADDRYELLTESLRGEGAVLVNDLGERFMFRYDPRGELAPRDVVVYGEWRELRSGRRIFLSLDPIGKERLKERFPEVSRLAEERFGGRSLLPVLPGAHYFVGGILTDDTGRTEVKNLYACGECAGTMVHGANRLASNSLLECVVFGMRCGRVVGEFPLKPSNFSFREDRFRRYDLGFSRVLERVRNVMDSKVGAVRRREELTEAREELLEMWDVSLKGRRVVNFALSVVISALQRGGSVGDHLVEENGKLAKEEDPLYHTLVEMKAGGELVAGRFKPGRCEP